MTKEFTLASWNIFQGLHFRSKPGAWIANESIVDHLRSLDADVLVLPEAWQFRSVGATWAEDIAAELGYELHQWIAPEPSRDRDIVPWRMVVLTRIAARRLPDHEFTTFGTFGRRALVRVDLVEAGLTLVGAHMYGIHLVLSGRPRAWLDERAAFRSAVAGADIVAGDMNIWGPIVNRDTPGHRLAVRGRTYPAHRPHSQIDHILVNDRVEVLESHVLPELGSDHRAIRAVLRARA